MPKQIWPFIIMHHSLGLLSGSVAYVYLAGNSDVQILCAMLLGAAVPAFANLPLFALGGLNGGGMVEKVNVVLQLCSILFMVCRIPLGLHARRACAWRHMSTGPSGDRAAHACPAAA